MFEKPAKKIDPCPACKGACMVPRTIEVKFDPATKAKLDHPMKVNGVVACSTCNGQGFVGDPSPALSAAVHKQRLVSPT